MKKLLLLFTALLSLSVFSADEAVAKTKQKTITLTKDNTLHLRSAFNSKSVSSLMEDATEMDSTLESGYPLYLVLYTPGGSIQAGLELFDFLDGLNRPVHTITMFAASMGFQTVQHLGSRYITRYGVLMAHKARGGFSGEFGGGLSQLDSRYGMWLRRVNMMDKQTVKRTDGKLDLKKFQGLYDNELWLNGSEAVGLGLADEVVTVKCDSTLSGIKEESFNFGFFSVTVVFSQCPVKTMALRAYVNILTNKGEMTLKDFLLQNGKFGDKCKDTASKAVRDWSGKVIAKGGAPELCALDKTLSLDKLSKVKSERIQHLNRNLKDSVEYSY